MKFLDSEIRWEVSGIGAPNFIRIIWWLDITLEWGSRP
jgi:hypothetical protein